MRFKLRVRVIIPALMAVVIFGGIASADLYLNDPYPRPGGDEIVSLSDPLFIQQSLDGTGCELMPVVDTDGDGAITVSDVLFSLQNYGCNSPPCNLPGPSTGTPIEILPDPDSPTFGLPGQTLILTATVSNTIFPSAGALGNCGDNAIIVDLNPFVEDDGIPVIFEITEDTGGGAYLGVPGATTLLTWVNSTDFFDLSIGAAQAELTLGNSGTVSVVARTRLLTNPPIWDNVLRTFQADFPPIITVSLDIHITSPADGTLISTTVTDVTVTTTAVVGNTIYLQIDGVDHPEISHVVDNADWNPAKGWYEFTIPNVDLWIDTPGDRWVTLISIIEATGGMSNIVNIYTDITAPSVAITEPTPPNTTIEVSLVTVVANCDDLGGSGIASCRVWVDGEAEQDSPGVFVLADGPHTAYARATDNVGNSTLSAPVPFTVFTGIIWVTITSPTDGAIFTTQDIPISGTYINAGANPTIIANGITMTDDGTTPDGNWNGVVDTGAEGAATITVTADDTFNIATASVNICVDTLDPTVSIDPLPCQTSSEVIMTGTVDGTGTCGPVSVEVNPGTVAANIIGSNWTATLTLSDGMGQAIDATATDAAGNTAIIPTIVDVDTQVPALTITSPTDGGVTNSTTVVVTGTATDGSGSGVAVVLVNDQTATGTENWSITFNGQTGNPSYSAVAIDSCGQQSPPQIVNITIDLNPPTAELISPADRSCWSSSAVQTDALCNDVGGQIAFCQVRIDGGIWQDVPVTVSGLSDGFHIAVARAIDQGANESFSIPHSFSVDTTAPIVSISSPSPDSWSGGTVVITGTVSDAIGIGDAAIICLGTTLDECVIFKFAGPLATPTYSESGSLDADFGDVDGDEALDIVVANHNGQNRLYLNDGTGIFTDGTSGRMPPDSDLSYDIELVDVNGDLAPDIFVSNYGQNRLYLNNGSGIFTDETAARLPVDNDQSRDAEFGDVDGDRDPDIIIANYDGQNRLYLNNGGGYFAEFTNYLPERSDASFDIELGDVNRDGSLDIVVANWAEQNRLYLNNGAGIFTDAALPSDTDYSRDANLADVDGDLDLDLFTANYFGQNRLYLNDGFGSFTDTTTNSLPPLMDNSVDAELTDIDRDGDPDLIVANYEQQNRFYLNDGSGVFSDITDPHLPTDMNFSRDMDFGDVDGDGDPDIIVANYYEQNLLYINNYGTVVQTVPVDPFGAFTGTFIMVSPGNYTATVTSEDNCGNPGSASVNFTVDTTEPQVDISSPVPGECIGSLSVVVDGSVTEISPYTILVSVSNATYTYTNSGASFPITVSGVTDGVYDIDAVVTDAGGNVGSAPTVVNVEVDTVEPMVTINLPIAGECIDSSTVCVDAFSDGGEAVSCTMDGYGPIDPAVECFTGVMDAVGYTIICSATDACGNQGSSSVTNIKVDIQAPEAPSISEPADTGCVPSSTVATDIICAEGSCEEQLDTGGWQVCSTGFSGVANGSHTIVATCTDLCGNVSAPAVSGFDVDTVAVVTITDPVDGVTIYAGNVVVSGTASTDIATVMVTSDQGHSVPSTVDLSGNWSVTLTGVNEPFIIITAQGTDDCGNTGSHSVTVAITPPGCSISSIGPTTGCPGDAVTIDGTNFGAIEGIVEFDATPAIVTFWSDTSIVISAPGGNYGNAAVMPMAADPCSRPGPYLYDDVPPWVNITAPADGATFCTSAVTVTATCNDFGGSGIVDCEVYIEAIGVWQPSPWFFVGVPDGPNTVLARAIDNCGYQTFSAPNVIQVDTTPPDVEITLPFDGSTVYSSTVVVVGTASDFGGTGIFWDEVWVDLPGASDTPQNVWVDPGGNWSTSFHNVAPDGPHTITAWVMDECGYAEIDLIYILVDTTPPSMPPVVTFVSPSSAPAGAWISIYGDNFQPGAEMHPNTGFYDPIFFMFEPLSGGMWIDSTQIDGFGPSSIFLPGTVLDVYVTNPDEQTGICYGCFTVGAAPPVVTFISPSSAPAGAWISIYGDNFQPGAEMHPNTGFYDPIFFMFEPLSGGMWMDSTQIDGFGPSSMFPPGTVLDVYVTNPDEQTGICYGCFTVGGVTGFAMSIESPSNGGFVVTVNGITYGSVIASIPFDLTWVNGTSPYDTSGLTVLANGLTTVPGSLLSVTNTTTASGKIQVACDGLAGSFGTITNVIISAYGVSDVVGPAAPDSVTVTIQLGEIRVEDVTVYEAVVTFIVPVNIYYDSIFGDAFDSYDIWVYYDSAVVNVDCALPVPVTGSDAASPFYAPQFGDPTVSTCDNFFGEVHFYYTQGISPTDPTGFFNVANINMIRVGAAGSSTDLTVGLLDFCNSSGNCYALGGTPSGYPWSIFPTYIKNGSVNILPTPAPEIVGVDNDGAEPYDNIVPSGIQSNWQIYGSNFVPGSMVVGCFDGPVCSCFGIAGQTAICLDLDGLPGGMFTDGDVLSSGEIDTNWEIFGPGGPVNLYIENPDGQTVIWGPATGDPGVMFE